VDLILLFKKIQKKKYIYYLNLVFFYVHNNMCVYFEISFYEAASKIWVGSIQSHISTSNMSDDCDVLRVRFGNDQELAKPN
jgi:hypothetical protein